MPDDLSPKQNTLSQGFSKQAKLAEEFSTSKKNRPARSCPRHHQQGGVTAAFSDDFGYQPKLEHARTKPDKGDQICKTRILITTFFFLESQICRTLLSAQVIVVVVQVFSRDPLSNAVNLLCNTRWRNKCPSSKGCKSKRAVPGTAHYYKLVRLYGMPGVAAANGSFVDDGQRLAGSMNGFITTRITGRVISQARFSLSLKKLLDCAI